MECRGKFREKIDRRRQVESARSDITLSALRVWGSVKAGLDYPIATDAVKNKNRSAIPLKGRKFAGWEGGLAPAQDRMAFNVEFTIRNLHLRRSKSAISKNCLTLNS
jgi:hypothetical protein